MGAGQRAGRVLGRGSRAGTGTPARRSRMPWALALALAVVAVLVGAPPASADDGLATAATSRYVLDEKATTVEATIRLDLRNVAPDRGNTYYFYNAFSVPVPAGAEKVRARSNGSSLPVDVRRTEDPSTDLARISFPDLRYGRSRSIDLTFEVPGEKPRARDGTRVGPGYATFAVYGLGDPGQSTVEVVAPSTMTFDATSDDFTATQSGDTTTQTATTTNDEGGFWAVVSLRDPERTDERPVDAAGTSLLLNGFQDDPKWADFVADRVTTGLPVLEKLVGAPWPGGLERIREDASPSLRGYDGWFDPSDDEIVIGERLDADLIFHELSHAWISGDRFDERWVSEGLAQVVAERTVEATGGEPVDHPKASRGSSGAVPLNDWGGSASSRSSDVDAYAYPAAYTATRALLGDLDDDTFAAVVGAGIRGERAYDPPGTADTDGGRTSWSRWLDLVETRGGVEDAAAVFRRWALTGEERAQLEPRAKARTAYAALDDADGAWLPPEGLRDAMTAWDFDRAASVRTKVAGLGPAAVGVQEAAERAGTTVPASIRSSYEDAEQDEQYAALASSLPRAAEAVTVVAAAERAADRDRDPVSALGATLLGVDGRAGEAVASLDDGDLAAATSEAQDATSRADKALLVGLAVPLVALLLLVALGWWVRSFLRARERRQTAEEDTRRAALAALSLTGGSEPARRGRENPYDG